MKSCLNMQIYSKSSLHMKNTIIKRKTAYEFACSTVFMFCMILAGLISLIQFLFGSEEYAPSLFDKIFMGGYFFTMILSLFGMIKYHYETDPNVQLRNKSIDELKSILSDDECSLWHSAAKQMLDKKMAKSRKKKGAGLNGTNF